MLRYKLKSVVARITTHLKHCYATKFRCCKPKQHVAASWTTFFQQILSTCNNKRVVRRATTLFKLQHNNEETCCPYYRGLFILWLHFAPGKSIRLRISKILIYFYAYILSHSNLIFFFEAYFNRHSSAGHKKQRFILKKGKLSLSEIVCLNSRTVSIQGGAKRATTMYRAPPLHPPWFLHKG